MKRIFPRMLTMADIARHRLAWAKHLQRKNEELEAEVKTLRVSDATLSAIAELIDPEGVLQNNENLLAEVVRLRELIEKVAVVWKDYNYEDRTEWFNNFCEVMHNERSS